jgi:NAD(P)-dependent dehydrogenase (short-subunit alcohol dehydrogenase family)
MARLQGKTAVILGAASEGNMGQVIARLFAAEGASVMVAGRNEEPLAALAADIGGHHALCDISSHSDVHGLAKTATQTMGRVDAAINCTGWALLANLLETSEEDLDRITALQFTGVHHFLQAFVGVMKDQDPQGGSIISLSSATTRDPINNHAAYIGTKTAGEAMIRCVANDFGQYGIKANSVSPAFTHSPMTADSFEVPGLVDAFLPRYPLGRLNTSDDVANACLWLASDESFVTGENLQPNGGLALRGNPQASDLEASIGAAMAKLQE